MRKRYSVLIALAVAMVLAAGCGRRPPNLLFITVDTTRADRLSCYGYTPGISPNLQGLSEAGVLFEDFQSVAPITLPSHTTFLTGLMPPEHGIRVNGENALAESVPTLQEVLRGNGYRTGAVVASPVLERIYGLARGFDHYDDYIKAPAEEKEGIRSIGDKQDLPYRPGEQVSDRTLAWLAEAAKERSRPWMIWAHYYDPHLPGNFHQDMFGDRYSHSYDAEIAYMDYHIGRLFDFLEEKKLKENTLVVVVGDHGEGLGDNGEDSHCFFIYRATQHVPLILTWKGKLAKGHRVKASLSTADLMPTILDIMGVRTDVYKPVRDERNESLRKMRGRSFAAAAYGQQIASRPCYMETLWGYHALRLAPLFGVVDQRMKYIRAPGPELYNLTEDPAERMNIYTQDLRRADELAITLEDLERGMAKPDIRAVSLNAQQLSRLQSLGYTGGGGGSRTNLAGDLSALVDPKDVKDVISLKCRIQLAIKRSPKHPETLAGCKKLVELMPKAAIFHSWLAMVLSANDQKDAAKQAFEEALRLEPEMLEVLNNYGVLLVDEKQYAAAANRFEAALRLKPHDTGLKGNLVGTLNLLAAEGTSKKNKKLALLSCMRIVELTPEDPVAHFNLGQSLMMIGRRAEARNCYQKALDLNPDYEKAREALERWQ